MSSPDTNQATESGASTQLLRVDKPPTHNSGDATAPASPTLSPEQFAAEFQQMADTLDAIRQSITDHAAELSLAAPNADAFVDGLCQISKVASSLNTWLIGAQLATRLGQPIKTNTPNAR